MNHAPSFLPIMEFCEWGPALALMAPWQLSVFHVLSVHLYSSNFSSLAQCPIVVQYFRILLATSFPSKSTLLHTFKVFWAYLTSVIKHSISQLLWNVSSGEKPTALGSISFRFWKSFNFYDSSPFWKLGVCSTFIPCIVPRLLSVSHTQSVDPSPTGLSCICGDS